MNTTTYHRHYPNGKLRLEIPLNNQEQRHGIQKRWHTNGQLQFEHQYYNDQLHGILQGWDKSGNLMYKNYYLHDRKVAQTQYEASKG